MPGVEEEEGGWEAPPALPPSAATFGSTDPFCSPEARSGMTCLTFFGERRALEVDAERKEVEYQRRQRAMKRKVLREGNARARRAGMLEKRSYDRWRMKTIFTGCQAGHFGEP
jgi:hypothetical protein